MEVDSQSLKEKNIKINQKAGKPNKDFEEIMMVPLLRDNGDYSMHKWRFNFVKLLDIIEADGSKENISSKCKFMFWK